MSVRNDDSITVTCILLYIPLFRHESFLLLLHSSELLTLNAFDRILQICLYMGCQKLLHGWLFTTFDIFQTFECRVADINADLNKGFLFNLHFSLLCTLPQVFFFFKISKNLFKYGKTNNYVFLSCRFSGTPCTFDFSLRKPHFSVIHLLLSFPLLGENNGSFLQSQQN